MDIKRIVIVGGESTGKSTLCAALAKHYDTCWVPEYARTYLEMNGISYTYADVIEMAKGHLKSIEEHFCLANRFLFIDTDMLVYKVWLTHKYNTCERLVWQNIDTKKVDLYLLTSPDIPWEYDPLREYPDHNMRNYFYVLFREMIINAARPYAIIRGNMAKRLNDSIEIIDRLFS